MLRKPGHSWLSEYGFWMGYITLPRAIRWHLGLVHEESHRQLVITLPSNDAGTSHRVLTLGFPTPDPRQIIPKARSLLMRSYRIRSTRWHSLHRAQYDHRSRNSRSCGIQLLSRDSFRVLFIGSSIGFTFRIFVFLGIFVRNV